MQLPFKSGVAVKFSVPVIASYPVTRQLNRVVPGVQYVVEPDKTRCTLKSSLVLDEGDQPGSPTTTTVHDVGEPNVSAPVVVSAPSAVGHVYKRGAT
jgi:hypothetical protein